MTWRFAVVAAVLCVGLFGGCSAQCAPCARVTAPPASCPTTTASAAPVVLTGPGSGNSAPFALAGGDYKATWSMAATGYCLHRSYLRSTDAGGLPRLTLGDGHPNSGENYLYSLAPGRYYLETQSTSGCGEWTITIGRQ